MYELPSLECDFIQSETAVIYPFIAIVNKGYRLSEILMHVLNLEF